MEGSPYHLHVVSSQHLWLLIVQLIHPVPPHAKSRSVSVQITRSDVVNTEKLHRINVNNVHTSQDCVATHCSQSSRGPTTRPTTDRSKEMDSPTYQSPPKYLAPYKTKLFKEFLGSMPPKLPSCALVLPSSVTGSSDP